MTTLPIAWRFRALAIMSGALLAVAVSGCRREVAVAAPPQLAHVRASQPITRSVTDFVDFTGRLDAVQSVDIRARVTGYLVQMPFKEGDEVKQGELLFLIDPRPYDAAVAQARASTADNEAKLKFATITNNRYRKLAELPNAVSQQDLDQYQANVDEAQAALLGSQAALETAQLNLGFTRVTSPINGQVSRYYLTLGNLVAQDSTLLTTVVSLDPIYAYFEIDERTVLEIRRRINRGEIKSRREGAIIPVYLSLQGEEGFPHQGTVNFVDNRIDSSTGTITVRGVFANPRPEHGARLLSPGMFVRIRLPLGQPHSAVLVADEAIGSDQGLKFVYVVSAENEVLERRVQTGALEEDGLRVVTKGLKSDEWVITSGLQLVEPHERVDVQKTPMPIPMAAGAETPAGSTPPRAPSAQSGSPSAAKPASPGEAPGKPAGQNAPRGAPIPAPQSAR